MQKMLKRILPFVIVVILVFTLYSLQYEDTLSVEEEESIEEFTEQQEEQEERLATLQSTFNNERFEDEAQDVMNQFLEGDPIEVAVVFASETQESDDWTDQFAEGLESYYGATSFDVQNISMEDMDHNTSSVDFVQQEGWTELQNYDVVIYEPLAHTDAGILPMEQTLQLTNQIINEFDGYPVLKIPTRNSQEWVTFAEEEDIQYVNPYSVGGDNPAFTQADPEDVSESFLHYFTDA
ncbi:putative RNA binding protein with dsRBD fold (UPF0201 family) [Geomicrobium halophilum]|uniref:Putative RNA binding protein with dsRBD fold (UPF0201 family) n=1 Tax=Geomicrobium halophilum TaxID=549000 RepID=A0A841PHX5_9BACL|nr:hypothetical protein [Geomicrobium halophilum]MBB6448390.1 putative RNA binding protein with dsRBD fold (UPF0201 family) [Geomicrobium halophilum]